MLVCHVMRLLSRLTNLLYPLACALCRAPGTDTPICAACRAAMPAGGAPGCTRCGVQLAGAFDAVVTCPACRRRPPAFQAARARWQYAGRIPEAIRQFKYHRRWRIGRWLSAEMAEVAGRSLPLDAIDAIVPVPTYWLKRRLRGWDSSGQLSHAVSRLLGKPHCAGALWQRRWTRTQTRLPWRGRFRNVTQAFVAARRLVEGKMILLVDDVLTSGATADACAQALRRAGARGVFVLTAARTPLK